MKAMILAAGRGERMRPLSDQLPKPLLPAAGRTLIVHQLQRLAAAGFLDVVVNLAWRGDRIRAALGDGSAFGLRLAYSDEGPRALGTGGGLLRALPLLGPEPFLAVNGDIWTDYPYAQLRERRPAAAHLVLVPNPGHHPQGDFVLQAGRVRPAGAGRCTFSGIGVYHPALFADCRPGRFALAPLLVEAMGRDQVSGELYRGAWFDIGTPERLAALELWLQGYRT